jgi:branched-chain amino acid transport system substrate-binding protein
LVVHVGLGGHELDRDQGGGFGRIPDGSFYRRVVVGLGARCRPGGRGGKRLQIGVLPRCRPGLRRDQRLLKYLYDKNGGHTTRDKVGEVLYNRGIINAIYDLEAIRTAQGKFGKKPLKGEEVQWGYEHLNITPQRITELGVDGIMVPIQLSCANHEGNGKVRIQQWDGKHWQFVSDWIQPDRAMLTDMYKDSALAYAKEKGITPRDCGKEM